jgi:hypothetical protein
MPEYQETRGWEDCQEITNIVLAMTATQDHEARGAGVGLVLASAGAGATVAAAPTGSFRAGWEARPVARSVADREALPDVLGRLDLVGHDDGIVLEGDAAALVGGKQCVLAEAELAGPLAGNEQR